jgi:hypothetical protein
MFHLKKKRFNNIFDNNFLVVVVLVLLPNQVLKIKTYINLSYVTNQCHLYIVAFDKNILFNLNI